MSVKTRPLWRLSDFVRKDLPELLVNDHATIPGLVQKILEEMSESALIEAYTENRELSLLDLKFAEVAMIRRDLSVPELLSKLVDFFAGDTNIPGLQYHELVEINPIDDLRTFTVSPIRETEEFFYNAHRQMEGRLRQIIVPVEDFLQTPERPEELLSSYDTLFDYGPFAALMEKLRAMDKDHFVKGFRPYVSSPCPIRDFDGPSGAYSWRIPYLELLVWGGNLPQQHLSEIEEKILYYSPEGRQKIISQLGRISSQPDAAVVNVVGRVPGAVNVLRTVIAFMRSFRKAHYRAAARQLPEQMADKAPGTSGNPTPGTFLRGRAANLEEMYEQFTMNHPAE